MRILGIDPGTVVVGYGIIDSQADEISLVTYDAITCSPRFPISERLRLLFEGLTEVILEYKPDIAAVEQPFVSKNIRTALAIGKAQAVAMLAASRQSIPVFEYTPAQVKRIVTNYGASSKEQIQKMVKLQLRLDKTPKPDDAADALAVAICHLRQSHLEAMLAHQEEAQ
jgi:crossover junction endodeoxyribonuclease RuvC